MIIIRSTNYGAPPPHMPIRPQSHAHPAAELDLQAGSRIVQPSHLVKPSRSGSSVGWLLKLFRLVLVAAVLAGAAMAVNDIQAGAMRGVVVPAATEARLAAVETWQAVTGSTGP